MDKDKNVVEEFLTQVNKDGLEVKDENPFANITVEQKEVPVEEKEEEEKPLAYHEDPKLRHYIEKQIAKATANLVPKEETRFREDVKEDGFIKAFETIIGNDTPDKIRALDALKNEIEELRSDARSAKEELQAERVADTEAEQELAQGFEREEENFNVDFNTNPKLRSEFIEFIERVAPKDENGDVVEYPDFNETFKLYQEVNKKSNTRAKELASRSSVRSSEASSAPMPHDTSWRGVEKFFQTLKGN